MSDPTLSDNDFKNEMKLLGPEIDTYPSTHRIRVRRWIKEPSDFSGDIFSGDR